MSGGLAPPSMVEDLAGLGAKLGWSIVDNPVLACPLGGSGVSPPHMGGGGGIWVPDQGLTEL